MSKAYDLTTEDDLSVLAKKVLEYSPKLNKGVNRATDRLSKRAPHFMTLSTLREVMRTFAGSSEVEENELEGLAHIAADFFEMLTKVRPELRAETAHAERDLTLASAGVMMHGYAALMRDFNLDIGRLGSSIARERWSGLLAVLAPANVFMTLDGRWSGDFMARDNPIWEQYGVTKNDPETGKITVLNTGGSRRRAGDALRDRVEGGVRARSNG